MALGSLFGIFLRRDVLTATAVLVVFPFLTYYLATSAFYRKARSKELGKIPPTVPFYFPLVFHTFSFMNTGPQKYFAQLLKEYEKFSPFIVRVPQPYVVLRDADQIAKVLAAPDFSIKRTHIDVLEKLFGVPATATPIYSEKQVLDDSRQTSEPHGQSLLNEYLWGPALTEFAETYLTILSKSMNDKMFQVGTWTQIEDVWSFFQQVISRCMIEALFGKDIFKQYPSIVRDFWKFSEAIEDFIPGEPKFMVPTAAVMSLKLLQQGLEKWLKANHSGTDFARIRDEDPAWDEFRGSKFVQRRDNELSRMDNVDIKARVADLLIVVHGSLSHLIPSTIWTLLEVLRRPQLNGDIAKSISRYRPSQDATYNIAGVSQIPIVQSTQAEISRLRILNAIVRIGTKHTTLIDENWSIPPDASILTLSVDMAQHTDAWRKARQESVMQPLEQFWAERFIVSGKTARKLQLTSTQAAVGEKIFSIEGLEGLTTSGSEHPHRHLGPNFAKQIYAATLAILFGEFEMQLCDADDFDAATPPIGETAYGTLKPLNAIAVRIRKRSSV